MVDVLRDTQLLDSRNTPTTTPMIVASTMPTAAATAVLTMPTHSASLTGWPELKSGSNAMLKPVGSSRKPQPVRALRSLMLAE